MNLVMFLQVSCNEKGLYDKFSCDELALMDHLIAGTAKDCSIMITFRKITHSSDYDYAKTSGFQV